MNFKLYSTSKKILADTHTPINMYLKLRDRFANSILYEYCAQEEGEDNFSFICCMPIAEIKIKDDVMHHRYPDGKTSAYPIEKGLQVKDEIKNFLSKFSVHEDDAEDFGKEHNQFAHGMFGYISYDAVKYFENIELRSNKKDGKTTPDVLYSFYQYVVALNHFKNEITLTEYSVEPFYDWSSGLNKIENILNATNFVSYGFQASGTENSNFTDLEFTSTVARIKSHCNRGDLFQLVLSREFSRTFTGDEFNVYRALRSLNPSPYLFFFDYGNFKLFGSSPEAQLIVKDQKVYVHPIAGTYRRTNNVETDKQSAVNLKSDKKENAEHVMLVDLARNDLSKNCSDVNVDVFRELHYYSHVIHLVSKVSGKIKRNVSVTDLVSDTFPAGTLTGAPKYNALQLIDKYEKGNRGFYGGCIGFIGFDGTFNSAIMIRTFLSKNNCLFYQAGAGIVESSNEQNELIEIENKLGALKKAIKTAEEL